MEYERANQTCKVIAEIGVNHCGSRHLLVKLIENVIDAKPDMVKFQFWQKGRFPEIEHLRLSWVQIRLCFKRMKDHGIIPFATCFDIKSLDQMNQEIWKIPSGLTTSTTFLKHISKKKGIKLISTGLTSEREIEKMLEFFDPADVVLMHCVSDYPTTYENLHLNTMQSYEKQFLVKFGLSSHIPEIYDGIAAAAMGATYVEKHVTLGRFLHGPDHTSSIEVDELKEMMSAIRKVEKAKGESFKCLSENEKKTKNGIRKVMKL